MKEVKQEITVIKYEAFDGTLFDSVDECANYEGSAFGVLIKDLESCIVKRTNTLGIYPADYFEPFNQYYFIVPKTRHDIFVLGQICKMVDMDESIAVTGNDCDNLIVLAVNVYCNTLGNAHIIRPGKWISSNTNGHFGVVSMIKEETKQEVRK